MPQNNTFVENNAACRMLINLCGTYNTSRTQLLVWLTAAFPFLALTQTSYPDPANWQLEQMPIVDEIGSNGIHGIAEDHEGYLWFASKNGVARYDGYSFRNYPAVSGDSSTLNHSRASFAYLDFMGVLWVGTRAGINRYIPQSDCFKQYNADEKTTNTIPDGEVNWIAEEYLAGKASAGFLA